MSKNSYSTNEVGALIESFRSDVSVIGEKVDGLSCRVDRLENRMDQFKKRLEPIETACRVAIPELFKRMNVVESKVL